MLAAVHSSAHLLQVLVVLLILACLGGAAYVAVALRNFVGAGVLVVVAVVAYILLL
jgi:hypothetical protein